jgi:hypothetical protein
MMAAGKGNQKSLSEEVDSDESEGDEPPHQVRPQSQAGDKPASQTEQEGLRHSGSSANTKFGEALYDDDDDDADDDSRTVHEQEGEEVPNALRDWRDAHAQSNADMDAQGQSLAGECLFPRS